MPRYFLDPVARSLLRGAMGILSFVTANTVQSKGLDDLGTDFLSAQQQATVAQQIQQATRNAEALLRGRDRTELVTPLEPGSWCIAECLDHLTQTTRAFLPAIATAIAEAPKLTKNRRLLTGILPSLFIRNLNPPYRFRFKVLPQLAPHQRNPETAWSSFVESQSELLAALRSAGGLAIDEVRIKSPLYARITYNLYGAFRMLAAHQSRHVWQMDQILKALDQRSAPALLKRSV